VKDGLAVYKRVTDHFLSALEKGVVPWRTPWTDLAPKSMMTGRTYSGVNYMMCVMFGAEYKSQWWVSAAKAKELGGYIPSSASGKGIPALRVFTITREDDNGTRVPVSTKAQYTVIWNVEEAVGIDPKYIPETKHLYFKPIELAEIVLRDMPDPPLYYERTQSAAFYEPSNDKIVLPDKAMFESIAAHYETRFHETIHATGHPKRLAREQIVNMVNAPFANTSSLESYGKEELIAGIGAAMLLARCGIVHQATLDNNTAYVANWADKLRADPKLIVSAASAAQKAVDYIMGTNESEENDVV